MHIGGYQMEDLGYGVEVREYEAGWSFFLQGDDAQQFREEWKLAQEYDIPFGHFLRDHEYITLFQ
jgi:hypothetical protein|tara:strand:+ start:324 stop:518 length:195 start_codon:yes stop_codon:yes gene_type:complete